MVLSFKAHSKRKIVAVYPGRFQMPHKGHLSVYNYLKKLFPNTFIATSNKVEKPKSPFNFKEKKRLLSFAGIPANKIIETKSPMIPVEITSKLSDDTILVIGAGQKSQDDEVRFVFKPNSYFQPYEANKNNLKPHGEHAYIVFAPTLNFKAMGKEVKSASELRALFKSLDHEGHKKLIKDLYGKFNESIHKLLMSRLL